MDALLWIGGIVLVWLCLSVPAGMILGRCIRMGRGDD